MGRDISVTTEILRKETENGFALVGTLLLMATALSCLIFVFFFQSVVQTNLEVKGICKDLNFQFQTQQKRRIEKLLSMNPQALRLRRHYFAAQNALRKAVATGLPPMIAAAEARVLYIEMQKAALSARQHALISQAAIEEKMFLKQLEKSIQKQFRSSAFVKGQVGSLAVQPENTFENGSPYRLKTNFMNEQKSQLVWAAEFKNYSKLPTRFFRQNLVTLPSQTKWENSCAATLEERLPNRLFVSITKAN